MTDPFLEGPAPYLQHLGAAMTEWRADFARFELELGREHMNRHENPHGGVHAALLDTAMGFAGCFTGDADDKLMALTLSLNVQYLSRPKGTRLIAEGTRTGGGKSTFFAEATITDETGELIAKGSGVFRYRRRG
ncbi:PaaI family thioesterase [Salipiger sp. PrR002]|uniref:PaaI family thioesterase n=1 Tax=Salipiger sp. PrR002 TaxID=2706489 RepID=UPI0013B751DE|nr:PaaI family thioesterase [Salipiger sp. PrR002]NDV98638.1 PaaI family thioesterase [Salipiger sp. PrR002]NDW57474.1 PaaI family thioesterase [Salipiger sp. PrR004]